MSSAGPLAPDSQEAALTSAPPVGDRTRQHRQVSPDAKLILLVEDDFVLRGALSELLREEGYAVESAANGIEALRRINQPPRPSLVLLDIMLPHMDGITFRTAQLAMPTLANIPVIVVSAVAISGMAGLSFARTFSKPIDTKQLLASIREVLEAPEP